MENNKVGLCLAHTGTNYGQLLQAYATQQVIERMGFETEIIKYYSGHNKGIALSPASTYVALKQIYTLVRKRVEARKRNVQDEIHEKNNEMRRQVSEDFRLKRLHNIIECNGITELRKKSENYFAVLVGSDQLWLPDVAISNFYTLRFAAPGVRRISYATSLGVSVYPRYAKKKAKEFWEQIDYLSVREQKGKEIIQSIADIPVEVVADPTYLLTKEEWETLIIPEKIIKDGYIVCYFLGVDNRIQQYARNIADKKGLRLVSILSNECNSDDSKYADEVLIGKTPTEFVNLIRNAELVLTDSFHGLAFSVINKKQFLVFYRKRIDVKESRNSRIDNIVQKLGLEECLVKDPEKFAMPENCIDYQEVSLKVEDMRCKSLNFLEHALKE